MKIIRNGIEIELTYAEMLQAYELMERNYRKEDIVCKAEEMEIELTKEEIDDIADSVDHALNNNNSYWDSYWLTIEDTIENRCSGVKEM